MRTAAALLLLACCACSPRPEQTWELTAQGIYTGTISANAELALVGSMNHGASLWRITDYERLYDWNHKAGVPVELVAAAFSADGRRAVTTDPRTLVMWNTQTGESLQYWGTPGAVLDAALVPGGSDVLLGLEDHSAILFDAADGAHKLTLLHEGQVSTVDVSDDGKTAVTGSDDNRSIVWSLTTGDRRSEIDHGNPVRAVALSGDASLLFTAVSNDRVAIWRADSGALEHVLHRRNPGVTSARFSADGSLLLLGTVNRQVELWQVASGERLKHWTVKAENPWHPTGSAILDVAFTERRNEFRALAGDGRLADLRG